MSKTEQEAYLTDLAERIIEMFDGNLEEILYSADLTTEEVIFYLLAAGLMDAPEVLGL